MKNTEEQKPLVNQNQEQFETLSNQEETASKCTSHSTAMAKWFFTPGVMIATFVPGLVCYIKTQQLDFLH